MAITMDMIKELRKKWLAKAAKKADREALEWGITIEIDGDKAFVVSISCETDFLSASDKFKAMLDDILNYLKENNITSIETAIEKKIAMPYVETCGYLIKIPVTNFPETVINDMRELETMNKKHVEISDGKEVQSYLLTKPNMNDGMNITFCSQEVQFEFLVSLNEKK